MYVLNQSSTKGVKGETPYEKCNGRKPNVKHLRVFGSIVYVKTIGKSGECKDRSKCLVFLGYETGSKANKCLDPITFKVHISKDVIFVESKSYRFNE